MKIKAPEIFFVLLFTFLAVSEAQLRVGFYSKTCPSAESTVRAVVQRFVSASAANAAVLLRLHFHDCFVQGCDGSILLRHKDDEMEARGNQGVGGLDIIDEAKAQLERSCPGVVSCADIVALAARDAVVLAKGLSYEVPTGRRDGKVSSKALAVNLPEVDDPISLLKSKFAEKGLSDKDLVLLTAGAHTIGTAACFFITSHLYNFPGGPGGSDPAISPQLLQQLKSICPFGGLNTVRVPLDWGSEFVFDDHIFKNIKRGFGVIASDYVLYNDTSTKIIIDSYLNPDPKKRANFPADFTRAMVKMGNIAVKTGDEGEIRHVCNTSI